MSERTIQLASGGGGLRALTMLVRGEAKMVIRDTAGLVIPVALPLLILVMNAMSSSTDEEIVGGRTVLDIYVLPIVFAIVIATIGIVNMPSFLTIYRKTGILRRLAVTPVSPLTVLSAQVIVSLIQALLGLTIAFTVAAVAFDARLPIDLGPALGIVVLSIAAMYALGMVVASLAPTPNAAIAIGLIVFFAIGALGGMFGGPDTLPDVIDRIGSVLPFGASVDGLSAAWAGETVPWRCWVSLAVTAVLGAGVAATTFRWDR
ncbi:ABC transporter permease [Aeromicrobium sp. YIM 150415]|uniref:ABC transporter permease n=1 Tax=Aeromicrobium sp. YIM 150415 TaxID=2803912 RepID=UPI001964A5C7|nr:ABC transporter permease [Aeromicrobium sp. YIM 150415]MBM9463958.1 ABC transporter permease [Aeromicrobium sp. YIM 150415]